MNSLEENEYCTQILYGLPFTDCGQTRVVNRSLGNLLQCLGGEHLTTWDTILPKTEFAYNSLINKPTGLSPFDIVTGYSLRTYRPSLSHM